jgi:hypothetical protein
LWRRAVKGGGVETGLILGNERIGLLRVAMADGSTTRVKGVFGARTVLIYE